jgi:hypothetical protein
MKHLTFDQIFSILAFAFSLFSVYCCIRNNRNINQYLNPAEKDDDEWGLYS